MQGFVSHHQDDIRYIILHIFLDWESWTKPSFSNFYGEHRVQVHPMSCLGMFWKLRRKNGDGWALYVFFLQKKWRTSWWFFTNPFEKHVHRIGSISPKDRGWKFKKTVWKHHLEDHESLLRKIWRMFCPDCFATSSDNHGQQKTSLPSGGKKDAETSERACCFFQGVKQTDCWRKTIIVLDTQDFYNTIQIEHIPINIHKNT